MKQHDNLLSVRAVTKMAVLAALVFVSFSCNLQKFEMPGAAVPPTADQDRLLPQVTVKVAGHSRQLHLQTFGDSARPPLFVLPGGPGADFRLLLPLRELADRFYVIMWDPRGAGLSERVTKEEISPESFVEEIKAVRNILSRDQPVRLIGHSYGALFLTRYTAENPADVANLILIEPGPMNPHEKTGYDGGNISFTDGQSFFWTNEILTSGDHAAADYKAIDLLPKASRNFTCDGSLVNNYPMWRFGAYFYHIMLQKIRKEMPKEFTWSHTISAYKGPIAVIAGTCGAASEAFQTKYNLPYLPGAELKTIPGAGHLSLFTDYKTELLSVVRNCLK